MEKNNPEDFPRLAFRHEQDQKFYMDYYGGKCPIKGNASIVDYYTDNLIYGMDLEINNGSIWVSPNPLVYRDYVIKNGYYLEIRDEKNQVIVYRTVGVMDPKLKHPISRTYNNLRCESIDMKEETKFLEFVHFKDMHFYDNLKIPHMEIRTFIDAGANFGMFGLSLYASGAKKGYLIEADPRLCRILNNSIALEGIEVVGKALLDKNTFLEFNTFSGTVNGKLKLDDENSNFSQNDRDTFLGTVRVPAIDINDFMENEVKEDVIDLFKIDIEGAEYPVFEKMTDHNLNRSKSYLIEFHDNTNNRVMGIINRLAINNYSMCFSKFDESDSENILQNKMGVIYAFKR